MAMYIDGPLKGTVTFFAKGQPIFEKFVLIDFRFGKTTQFSAGKLEAYSHGMDRFEGEIVLFTSESMSSILELAKFDAMELHLQSGKYRLNNIFIGEASVQSLHNGTEVRFDFLATGPLDSIIEEPESIQDKPKPAQEYKSSESVQKSDTVRWREIQELPRDLKKHYGRKLNI